MAIQGAKLLTDSERIDLVRERLRLTAIGEQHPLLCGETVPTDPAVHQALYNAFVLRLTPRSTIKRLIPCEGIRRDRTFAWQIVP